MGLSRKNGTLKGVEVQLYNPDTEEWDETTAVGWRIGNGFFVGVGEREDGYDVEIVLSKKFLLRVLAETTTI